MMFESSQFDGNAGGGGGVGFVSSQSADPSPTSAKSRDNQPMYPVTVKQISEASLSTNDKTNFVIHGVDVYNVKLVGMVFNLSKRVTDVSFVIDDSTGRIDCHRWVNDSQDTMEVDSLMNGVYVRVHGYLRSFQGKKQVVVYAIRPVNDYNEIACHFIECMHAYRSNTRSQMQSAGSASTSIPSAVSTPNGYQAVSSIQFSQEYNLDGLGTTDKMVLDYLQLPSSICQEKGVHRDEIAQKLKLSKNKIMEVMESLESEGLVYSTIDEFHYKSTAS